MRTSFEVTPETREVVFRGPAHTRLAGSRGWVTVDTHVHFLSPQGALLEGKAEGVNVVNLLAAQWARCSATSGISTTAPPCARDFGGDGEFLVRVGTENRQQARGTSLLGYSGAMIHPPSSGGPAEGATSATHWKSRWRREQNAAGSRAAWS